MIRRRTGFSKEILKFSSLNIVAIHTYITKYILKPVASTKIFVIATYRLVYLLITILNCVNEAESDHTATDLRHEQGGNGGFWFTHQ